MPRSKTLPRRLARWVTLRQLWYMWTVSGTSPAPSMRTLRHWCLRGAIPASKKRGGDWRVDMQALKSSSGEDGRELYEDLVSAVNQRGL